MHFDENKTTASPLLNRHFLLSITINKAGKIQAINLFSFSKLDSIETLNILAALEQTDNKWINNSGKDQTIVLPISYIYDDKNDNPEKFPDLQQEFYSNWNKVKLIFLERIIVFVRVYLPQS